jgi:hypothetical protein
MDRLVRSQREDFCDFGTLDGHEPGGRVGMSRAFLRVMAEGGGLIRSDGLRGAHADRLDLGAHRPYDLDGVAFRSVSGRDHGPEGVDAGHTSFPNALGVA